MNHLKGLVAAETFTSVDAVGVDDTVRVHDIAALPESWTSKFNAAVLCRSIWFTDRMRIINEAVRIVQTGGRIIVCHGFNPAKSKHWNTETHTNMLKADFEATGCDVEYEQHTPDTACGLFQYMVFMKRVVSIKWAASSTV